MEQLTWTDMEQPVQDFVVVANAVTPTGEYDIRRATFGPFFWVAHVRHEANAWTTHAGVYRSMADAKAAAEAHYNNA